VQRCAPDAWGADPAETNDWVESLDAVLEAQGKRRARFLIKRVIENARRKGVLPDGPLTTDFVNTIPPEESPDHPGDSLIEKRIRRIIRWNAVAMLHRANVNSSRIR